MCIFFFYVELHAIDCSFFQLIYPHFTIKKKTQTDSSLHEHNLSGKFSNTFTFYLLRKVNQGIPDSKLKFEYP